MFEKLPDRDRICDVQYADLTGADRRFEAARRRGGILVVDDMPMITRLLALSLKPEGFEVWQAHSGREAISLFKLHHDRIDLVLMDVRMPDLDGPQTLRAIQKITPGILCCFMSGSTGEYSEKGLLEMGAHKLIAKPFRISDVTRVVHTFMPTRTASLIQTV